MTKHSIRLATAGICTLLALGAPQLSAQPSGSQPAPTQQTQSFSDKKIERFAKSFGEIMEIRKQFTAELQQTNDAEQARKLQKEVSDQMMSVIDRNDITVGEYNAIAQAMQTDDELRSRIVALLE
jgi:CBS-domain-containing membrane protein